MTRSFLKSSRRRAVLCGSRAARVLALALVLALTACAPDEAPATATPPPIPAATGSEPRDGAAGVSPEPSARVERPLVVFLGDSLTAGYGVDEDQAFPAVIERRLRESGTPVRVVNAGVSGDTTAGGLARLDWVMRQRPDVLVVGLGGNDGLRGLDPKEAEANLRAIVQRAKDDGAEVLLLGMRMPPSHGADYTKRFEAIYENVARADDVPLVPFLLEGVGGSAELNLPDGIHPTPRGHEVIADNVAPYLSQIVRELSL